MELDIDPVVGPNPFADWRTPYLDYLLHEVLLGMKTDQIRMDITDIIFVFTFLVKFGFEYG